MISLDEDKQAIVMGLGRFGGGLGATRYLLNRGMRVLVTDRATEAELEGPVRALRDEFPGNSLEFALGGHDEVSFEDTDLLVVNPAVPEPWNNDLLKQAEECGLVVCTEIELLLDRFRALGQDRLIVVTGSAGKSTTCSMIAHLARQMELNCLLGGNIGGSLLSHKDDELTGADVVVLELSSFMLHWIHQRLVPFSPAVGVLTSLDENHVDWHGSLEHYIECKSRIRDSKRYIPPINESAISGSIRAQQNDSSSAAWWTVAQDDWSVKLRARILDDVRTGLPGHHQKENAATACVALSALLSEQEDPTSLARSLVPFIETFKGLEHRLRPLGVSSGILVVDDSKSTTPGATQRAVEAFDDPSKIHLIAGGYDKGADLSTIVSLSTRLGGLYGVGQTGEAISSGENGIECHTIENAVNEASKHVEKGDVLLLSPGCASWDQFSDYQARGRAFKQAAECALGSLK